MITMSTLPSVTVEGVVNVPATVEDTLYYMIKKGWIESAKLKKPNGRVRLTVYPNRAFLQRCGIGPDNQTTFNLVSPYLKDHGLRLSVFESNRNKLWVFIDQDAEGNS
jgi:hypothetical protein